MGVFVCVWYVWMESMFLISEYELAAIGNDVKFSRLLQQTVARQVLKLTPHGLLCERVLGWRFSIKLLPTLEGY